MIDRAPIASARVPGSPWLLLPAIALAIAAACFVTIGIMSMGYAIVLAATHQGVVDPARMNEFGQLAGVRVGPALRVVFALLVARWLAAGGRLDRAGALLLAACLIVIDAGIGLIFGDLPNATDAAIAVLTAIATCFGQHLGDRDRRRAAERDRLHTALRRAVDVDAIVRAITTHLPGDFGFDIWAGSGPAARWLAGTTAAPPTATAPPSSWLACGDEHAVSLRDGMPAAGHPIATATDAITTALERICLRAEAERIGARRERERLASEIHDTIAQDLAGASTQLEAAASARSRQSEAAAEHLRAAGSSVRNALAELRGLVWALRPEPRRATLPVAMQRHLDRLAIECGVEVLADLPAQVPGLAPEAEHCLLRVLQESSRNAVRHGKARQLEVTLTVAADAVVLLVADDGCGFEVSDASSADTTGGHGLSLMRERVARLGGGFSVESAPGRGTRASARLPRAHGPT